MKSNIGRKHQNLHLTDENVAELWKQNKAPFFWTSLNSPRNKLRKIVRKWDSNSDVLSTHGQCWLSITTRLWLNSSVYHVVRVLKNKKPESIVVNRRLQLKLKSWKVLITGSHIQKIDLQSSFFSLRSFAPQCLRNLHIKQRENEQIPTKKRPLLTVHTR